MNEKQWGFVHIILVYAGIMLVELVYSLFFMDGVNNSALGASEIGSFLISFLIQFVATVGLVYLLAVYRPHGKWQDLGVVHVDTPNYLKYGVGGGLALFTLVILMSIPLNYFQPELPPQYFEQVLRTVNNLPGFLLILVVGSVLGPFSEEIFYRGMIYPVFRKHLGPIWGAILAGILFGAVHGDIWRALPLAAGGIGLCFLYERTRSILVTTVAHGVWNGIMSMIVYFSIIQGV